MANRVGRSQGNKGNLGGIILVLVLLCVFGALGAYWIKRAKPETPAPAVPPSAAPSAARTPLPPLPSQFPKGDPLSALMAEGAPQPNTAPTTLPSPPPVTKSGLDATLAAVLEKHGAERETALTQLLQDLRAANDTAGAVRVGRLFAESHPSSAMAWAAEIAGTKEGVAVAAGVAEGLTELRGGISWADALPAPEARAKALGVLIGRLAESSPSEAAVWLRRIPKGADRDQTVVLVVTAWAGRNPEAARGWVEKNQQALEGTAIAAFAGAWARSDSAAAVKWARGIKDPAKRSLAVSAATQAVR